jgi:hypothetical protein
MALCAWHRGFGKAFVVRGERLLLVTIVICFFGNTFVEHNQQTAGHESFGCAQ